MAYHSGRHTYTPIKGPASAGPDVLGVKRTDVTGDPRFVFWRYSSNINDMLLGEEDFICGSTPDQMLQELRDRNPAPGGGIERVWFCAEGICVSAIPLADEAVVKEEYLHKNYGYYSSAAYMLKADAIDTLRAVTVLGDHVLVEAQYAEALREHPDYSESGLVVSNINAVTPRSGPCYLQVRSDIKKTEAIKKARATKERKASAKAERARLFGAFGDVLNRVVNDVETQLAARVLGYVKGEKIEPDYGGVTRGNIKVRVATTGVGVRGRFKSLFDLMALDKRLPGKKIDWKNMPEMFEIAATYGDLPPQPWTEEEAALVSMSDEAKALIAEYRAVIDRNRKQLEKRYKSNPHMAWNPGKAVKANSVIRDRDTGSDDTYSWGDPADPYCLVLGTGKYDRWGLIRIASAGNVRRFFCVDCGYFKYDYNNAQCVAKAYERHQEGKSTGVVCDILINPWYVAKCADIRPNNMLPWVRKEIDKVLALVKEAPESEKDG